MSQRSYGRRQASYTASVRVLQPEIPVSLYELFFLLFFAIFLLFVLDIFRSFYSTYANAALPSPAAIISDKLLYARGVLYSPKKVEKAPVPLVNEQRVILAGPRDRKVVALTFDGDMTYAMKSAVESGEVVSYYDRKLFEILNHTQTKATLFLSGLFIELYPDITRELAANPLFELSNHSYSHPSFHGSCYGLPSTPFSEAQEIAKTDRLLREVAGVENRFFRFPGGCYSQEDVETAEMLGLRVVHWDVVADDGFNDNKQAIVDKVVNNVQNGSIIVMHMNGYPNEPQTAAAMPEIVDKIRQKGFEFVTLSELLSPKSPTAVNIRDYIAIESGI